MKLADPVMPQPPAQKPKPAVEMPLPATDGVRIFANDEATEMDLDAATMVPPSKQEVKPVEVKANDTAPKTNTVAPEKAIFVNSVETVSNLPADKAPDQTLLNRIVMTFGSALAAASAIRIFFG